MLRFSCPSCSARLTAREDRAGREALCPKCKSKITIPRDTTQAAGKPAPASDIALIEPLKAPEKRMPDPPSPAEEVESETDARRDNDKLLLSLGITPLPEHTGKRQWPWPIDILLYPTSHAGLAYMAVIVIAPLLPSLIRGFFGPLGAGLLGGPILLGGFVIDLYIAWYMAECVYDSARGGTRAPDAFGLKVGWTDVQSRIIYILGVWAVYIAPVLVYYTFVRRVDAILLALAAWAVLFFPMGLLAMALHDSSSALNPLFLLGSIFRAFFQYVGLLLLIGALGGALWLVFSRSGGHAPLIWLQTVRNAVVAYAVFLLAHILGRFYWRYRERLDWGL